MRYDWIIAAWLAYWPLMYAMGKLGQIEIKWRWWRWIMGN